MLCRPLGGSMALWGPFAERLATRLRVIAFDPRGVGASSDLPPGHSTRAMAADALGLLDALGVGRAHVFGLSLGGMVATWLAIDAPRRVDRLVLASTLPGGTAVSRHGLPRAWSFARCFAQPGPDAEACLLRRILSPEFRLARPERVAELERAVRATPARRQNLLGLALAAARHRPGPALARVESETLLLFGERDPIARSAARKGLVEGLPRSQLATVAGAGHDVSLERPEEVADEVLGFLLQK
ncbi:MAG TPA: alpha/beta hydrolase [Polyangiaceae bacterium]|nr:alpha/beta hydrolase [Polyangiaceae bacterium]